MAALVEQRRMLSACTGDPAALLERLNDSPGDGAGDGAGSGGDGDGRGGEAGWGGGALPPPAAHAAALHVRALLLPRRAAAALAGAAGAGSHAEAAAALGALRELAATPAGCAAIAVGAHWNRVAYSYIYLCIYRVAYLRQQYK